ncbi:hypothetical protein SDC9_118863 [bioreactor metagenome]|uniref:Uncharacterized protein n=1 Tax=bioreactor metagenome TaxID=1076179 RepID=A0A645C2L9_9ZZZZ
MEWISEKLFGSSTGLGISSSKASPNPLNRSPWMGCLSAGFGTSIFSTRLINVLNSSSSNISLIAVSFISFLFRLSISISIGTSVFIVAKNFENKICSLFSSIFVLSVPFSLFVFLSKFSTDPNSSSSFSAVFGPTPGQPGILSDVSPIRPSKSITWHGCETLYFSITFLSSSISNSLLPYFGLYIKMCSSVNCP